MANIANTEEKIIRVRSAKDKTENWEKANPILLDGEIGIEMKPDGSIAIKVGDGKTAWKLLQYVTKTIKDADAEFQNLQKQLDNIVLASSDSGDVTAEVVQARVDVSGTNHPTLKNRLDAEQNALKADILSVEEEVEQARGNHATLKARLDYMEDLTEVAENQIPLSTDAEGNVVGLIEGHRYNSYDELVEDTTCNATGFIPVSFGDKVTFKGIKFDSTVSACYVRLYNVSFTLINGCSGYSMSDYIYRLGDASYDTKGNLSQLVLNGELSPTVAYLRIAFKTTENEAQITINEGTVSKIDEAVKVLENKVAELEEGKGTDYVIQAESVAWLKENGDTSKVYVLPDGYIYGMKYVESESRPAYTNLANPNDEYWLDNMRLNSSCVETATEGAYVTNYIPCKYGDIIRIKGAKEISYPVWFYTEDEKTKHVYFASDKTYNILDYTDEINTFKAGMYYNGTTQYDWTDIAYLRLTLIPTGSVDDIIITVNEEIKEEIFSGYTWEKIGYEDRVQVLENAVAEIKNNDESTDVTIPEYWKAMVETKTGTIKALQEAGGKDCVCFAWASDTHIPDALGTDGKNSTIHIGKVMAKMLDNCEIPFAVISGDVATRASFAEEATYLEKLAELPIHLAPLWGTERLVMALGNHDGCYGDSTGYYRKQFSPERMWQRFFRSQALDFRRVFSDDGTYFYIDNEAQRTRFIVLNSHFGGDYAVDSNGWAVNNRFGTSCFGQEQLDWLAGVALDMPQGYSAVITMHVPPNVKYTVDKEQFIGIVNAYNNKSTYSGSYTTGVDGWTNNSVSVDFTQAKGEIIAVFTGHVHGDSVDTTTLSCPLLTILSAGATANEPYAATAPARTKGTDTETNFDVVTIDKKTRKIYCTRIGAGSDREISY